MHGPTKSERLSINPEESKSSELSKIHKDSSVSSTGNNSEYVNVAPEFKSDRLFELSNQTKANLDAYLVKFNYKQA